MKKIILIFVAVLLVTGCSFKKTDTPKNYGNDEGLILLLKEGSMSVKDPEVEETRIYSDKTITYSQGPTGSTIEIGRMQLTDTQYQNIIDAAFKEDFLNLKSDIGQEVEGGYSSNITIYYDGKEFTTGGQNVDNKTYNKLLELIYSYQPKNTTDNN